MTKKANIRRIIGITALALWVVAIVPRLFLGKDMLIWQLENWALIFAPILTLVYSVMFTSHFTKEKHLAVKISGWISCVLMVLLCVIVFCIAGARKNTKVWNDKDYVVYLEDRGFIDPDVCVLYKRDGVVYRRMYIIGSGGWAQVNNADYKMYESLDLIKEEVDWSTFDGDIIDHITVFYRLSDGKQYDQDKNDSLLALINQ
ncbi:MAG: hypothetical protein J6T88_09095 [Bacteroidales bacterium]|nr:hypothetical protein [Bacteroidales bacterium]